MIRFLHAYVAHYGYWTIALVLLAENTGIPAPGETVLLLAGFLAKSHGVLSLNYVILVATLASAVGDNLGYWIGSRSGRRWIDGSRWFSQLHGDAVARGERLFARFGPAAIFFARFVFGLRIIAGPLAGVLKMPWKRFTLFNVLGAAAWSTTIAYAGYSLSGRMGHLERFMGRLELGLFAVLIVVVLLIWRFGRINGGSRRT